MGSDDGGDDRNNNGTTVNSSISSSKNGKDDNGRGGHKPSLQRRKKRPQSYTYAKLLHYVQQYIPTEIVCKVSSHNQSNKPAHSVVVEWGLLLSLLFLLLWLCSFGMTTSIVPSASSSLPLPQQQQEALSNGQPLNNVAHPNRNTKQVVIPPSKWPVSIRTEDKSTYDVIVHPGDGTTVMRVPKFWSLPIHNQQLMTRETAMQIGSCIDVGTTTDPNNDNHSIGDACPLSQRTIYVGIASYRDFECRSTVESIFLRAQHPERIRVGVVDQIVDGEDVLCNDPIVPCTENPNQALCKYAEQVDVYQMKAELSIGPVYARHLGYRLYRGEYYTVSDKLELSI
jgi:Glycosyltransferase (GlcNAc)